MRKGTGQCFCSNRLAGDRTRLYAFARIDKDRHCGTADRFGKFRRQLVRRNYPQGRAAYSRLQRLHHHLPDAVIAPQWIAVTNY
jgi:hypothetical protein